MSSLKMYNFSPEIRGRHLPEGFSVSKYTSEADIKDWVDICSNGLVDAATAYERFRHELTELDGPDPCRDTYFIEKDGERVATYTAVPDMWSTGMGYIHMVAVKPEYRGLGLGSFIADECLRILKGLGKEKIFLLTGDTRYAALATYIKAGFLPVNYIDDEGKDMVERWQKVVDALELESLMLLDEEGNPITEIKKHGV